MLLAPQSENWGAFRSGDERIDRKLLQQVVLAQLGMVRLHGVRIAESVGAALSLQAGVLQAPMEVIQGFGVASDVPTLHIEVLAVREDLHGQGLGRSLLEYAIEKALDISVQAGVKTLSLEATPESVGFYTSMGSDRARQPWPDGRLAMWLVLA